MGRHSIPDPDESPAEEQPEEAQTERFGYTRDVEPDYGPGYRQPEYGTPERREPEYREPGYPEPDYPRLDETDYDDGGYDEPGYGRADYPAREYPEFDRADSSPPPTPPRMPVPSSEVMRSRNP